MTHFKKIARDFALVALGAAAGGLGAVALSKPAQKQAAPAIVVPVSTGETARAEISGLNDVIEILTKGNGACAAARDTWRSAFIDARQKLQTCTDDVAALSAPPEPKVRRKKVAAICKTEDGAAFCRDDAIKKNKTKHSLE